MAGGGEGGGIIVKLFKADSAKQHVPGKTSLHLSPTKQSQKEPDCDAIADLPFLPSKLMHKRGIT